MKALEIHPVEDDVDLLGGNVGLDLDAFGQGSRHGKVTIDPRMQRHCMARHGTVHMIDGRRFGKGGDRDHGVEVMLSVDDVGNKLQFFDVGGQRDGVDVHEPPLFFKVTTEDHDGVAARLKSASQIPDVNLRPAPTFKVVVGDEDLHAAASRASPTAVASATFECEGKLRSG